MYFFFLVILKKRNTFHLIMVIIPIKADFAQKGYLPQTGIV